jgi:hypothetical protein
MFRIFRLAGPNDDDVFPSLTETGAFLAKNVPLLEQNETGFWRPRPQECLETTLSAGYRFPVDLSRRMQSLETVAKALNDNNLSASPPSRLFRRNFRRFPITLHGEWQKPKNWQKPVLHI